MIILFLIFKSFCYRYSISYLYESVNLGYDLYTATKEDLEGQDYDANSLLADLCSEDIENQRFIIYDE